MRALRANPAARVGGVARTVGMGLSGGAISGVAPPSAALPGTSLGIASVPNLRDVGGYETRDGTMVRRGVAYRSGRLNPINAADRGHIAALGLKTVFDLRAADERSARPDQLPAGVNNVWLNVLADVKGDSASRLQTLIANPKEANKILGGGKVEMLLMKVYRNFITLPSANTAYRQLFVELGTPCGVPALFHCSAGKDRTGWAAAALLTLLGVPEQTVLGDYLRSNEYMFPAYQTFIDQFAAAGGEASIPQDLVGVKVAYLTAAFDEMQARYGAIDAYFADGLGIDTAGQQRLRDRFLFEA